MTRILLALVAVAGMHTAAFGQAKQLQVVNATDQQVLITVDRGTAATVFCLGKYASSAPSPLAPNLGDRAVIARKGTKQCQLELPVKVFAVSQFNPDAGTNDLLRLVLLPDGTGGYKIAYTVAKATDTTPGTAVVGSGKPAAEPSKDEQEAIAKALKNVEKEAEAK